MYTIVSLKNKTMRIIFTLKLWSVVYMRLEYYKNIDVRLQKKKSTSRWILTIVPVVILDWYKSCLMTLPEWHVKVG